MRQAEDNGASLHYHVLHGARKILRNGHLNLTFQFIMKTYLPRKEGRTLFSLSLLA